MNRTLQRHWVAASALALIGIVAVLPMAMNLATDRSQPVSASAANRTASVTLTCFDRDMRRHNCDVRSGSLN